MASQLLEIDIEIIRKSNLLAQFPKRTEADLFIWAWKNDDVLEELVLEDEKPYL